jgi:hypothetical protein
VRLRRTALTCFVLFALLSASPALGQFNPSDLTRAISDIQRHLIPTVSVSPTQQNHSHKAAYQYGLAPVIVGSSEAGSPIGYRLTLLVLIPTDLDDLEESRVRGSLPGLLEPIARDLRNKIDWLPGLEEPGATTPAPDEDVGGHFVKYSAAMENSAHDAFVAASQEFDERFSSRFPAHASDAFLAIGLRPCAEPSCPLGEFAHRRRDRSTDRFGKLYGWMKARGLTATNTVYMLNPQGSFWSVTAKLDRGYEWHQDFPAPVLQAALVNAANRSRKNGTRLSYSAAELAGVSKEAAAHIADVFDSAYAAAIRLPSKPGDALPGISDELGRTRLLECVRLRGTFDADEAGKCAGYKVTPAVISDCIAGRECTPVFGNQVNLESLTYLPNAKLDNLSQNSALPRINMGTVTQFADTVNKCNDKRSEDRGFCLVESSLSRDSNNAKTLECVRKARRSVGEDLENCAVLGLSEEDQVQVACFHHNPKDYRGLALCASRDVLPASTQKFFACASNVSQRSSTGFAEAATCLGAASGSREAGCLAAHNDAWQDAALCMSGNSIPPQVQSAIHCATTSESLAAFGVCMVANVGNGEAQRIAACYVEGQGVPAAVAVCIAAKDLTQDQRIVLECAAETNGYLPATAICTGGKLAVKEMMYCQGKHFGEDKCFGDGNEIRKFTKAIGVEIGPHSVVADIANLQLRIMDVTETPVLQAGMQGVSAVFTFASNNRLIPNPQDPKTFITVALPPGPLNRSGIDPVGNYCDHNWCPPGPKLPF